MVLPNRNLEGALWMIGAGAVFSLQGVAVKELGTRLDVFQIAFVRCFFGLLVTLPFVLRGGTELFLTGRPALHVMRALAGVSGMFCGMYAIAHLPLADAVAISFAKPLFAVCLAAFFLGEKVGLPRWLATFVGFLGVALIARPGSYAFEVAHIAALLGAFFIADVVVLVKKLQGSEKNATIMAYFGIVTSLASVGPALYVWLAPTLFEFALLVGIAVAATLGQWMALRAYRAADASAVVPFDYLRLVFSILFGWAIFAEVPDRWTLAGTCVLIAATAYIAFREIRMGRKPSLGGG
ncbi:MAG: DMT family transporter [Rhodospirillales bacterium]|jgi:drug/metabolite transporter (DMT)-like permease